MTQTIVSYKNLIVWQKSISLVLEIYNVTKIFPNSEIYGLVSQMRRSAVSISSNIAEGRRRGSKKDFRNFLTIAFGSGAELETQIEISKRVFSDRKIDFDNIDHLLDEIMRMLNVMIHRL